jgi:hypothetical protein
VVRDGGGGGGDKKNLEIVVLLVSVFEDDIPDDLNHGICVCV